LNKKIRRAKIFDIIKDSQVEILCLQELSPSEECHYHDYLKSLGYQGVFHSQVYRPGALSHGCGVYYKTDKIKLISEKHFTYEHFIHLIEPPLINNEVKKHLQRLSNLAVIMLFECENTRFLLATTHLHWNPNYECIKFIQAKLLIQELIYVRSLQTKTDIPIVIAGDFNSTPKSLVYDFFKDGELSSSDERIVYKRDAVIWGDIVHNLNLDSAYRATIGEPEITNIGDEWRGTIDYIWYTKDTLKPVNVVPLPVPKDLLPDSIHPSDHLPLQCTLQFIQ